ncbi:MAG TPA: alcohol dehydrogenase catalytic domain-containing protein [Candidatus Dormibacteraeota bacterium]|jgi:L-iditol 2-dehydrogenase|nr:alcohol dehydrogenase catalytic domain-containing protein [Candidatus Dormibacteraeota bacterium]
MRTAHLYGVRDLRVEDVAEPEPGPGEALIRIHACGVCPSDLRGYLGSRQRDREGPWTPGHEWAGTVEAIGDDEDGSGIRVGDRVVADWRVVCGRCYQCRRGVFNYCERLSRTVRGGYAEYGVAPLDQLRVLPDQVPFEAAAFCEPLACIINAHSYTEIPLGGDVVIVGAGPIGLLHLQVALARGGRVMVSDPIAERRQKALELGAHVAVDAADPIKAVLDLTEGRGANTVIVAVGGEGPIRQGLAMAAINGWVNIFAGTHPPTEMPFDPNLVHYRQLRVTGSHDFSPHHFTTALRLIQFGIVRVTPLISHRFPLDGVVEAFETTAGRRGFKSMVLPYGGENGS